MRKNQLLIPFLALALTAHAQQDSTDTKPKLSISGYLDFYYAYDFERPQSHEIAPYFFSYRRHDEISLNLGMVKFNVDGGHYRANLGFAVGNYPEYNLSEEPASLRHIYEANAGIALGKKNKAWLDAGIFGSHVGYESAFAQDNWTLTHALFYENTPAYLAGAKLTWQVSEAWTLMGLVCNGWQHIYRTDGNSFHSFGTQLTFSKNGTTYNWSSFVSANDPDTLQRVRIFNDFYGKFQVTQGFSVVVGLDLGLQQRTHKGSEYDLWFSPVLVQRQTIGKRWALACRLEYYSDEKNVLVTPPSGGVFKTVGASLNADFSPYENVLLRLEGRWLNSEIPAFETSTGLGKSLEIVMASVAVRFP